MYRRHFVCREARREPGLPMSDDLPRITDERLGEMIINAIIYSHLFEPECPECGRCGGMVVVWAANAPEQVGAFVREHFPRT